MKKMALIILIMVFGIVGSAYAQSAKDVYKVVKKAESKAAGSQRDVDNSIADARAEVDLFKDSKEAKKNPEFTKHIEAALMALRNAQFAKEVTKNADNWKKSMDEAERELEKAKQYLR